MSKKRVTCYIMSDWVAIVIMLFILMVGWDAEASWALTISDGDTHTTPEWEDYGQCAYWRFRH